MQLTLKILNQAAGALAEIETGLHEMNENVKEPFSTSFPIKYKIERYIYNPLLFLDSIMVYSHINLNFKLFITNL